MILSVTAAVLVFASAVFQAILMLRKSQKNAFKIADSVIRFTAAAALILITIQRSVEIRFAALLGTYDALVFYSFCILLVSALYAVQKKLNVLAPVQFLASVISFGLFALASSPLVPSGVTPPVPALQSGWLVLHVGLSFIGEAFFVFSFICAVLFLASKNRKDSNMPDYTYKAVIIGYPVFTLGAIIFGAVWAENAWGNYWSWDPKEVWALITWLVYTLYLHIRLRYKKKKKMQAWVAVLGFICTLITFFGVNYLIPSLHSYR
jgi:ABC-type transport system involved in cytochrome c biogenesis permease subunit